MVVDIDDVLERAFEEAFLRALVQTVQAKAEDLFKRAFTEASPLSQRLQEKSEQGFQHFVSNGICWEKKKPGFKK